jgi:integrase
MPPIQTTEARVLREVLPDRMEWRDALMAQLGNYDELASRPWEELRQIEFLPGCRLDAPVLMIPAEWMAAGTLRRDSARQIVPAKAGVPSDPVQAAVRDESIRRALLALFLPRIMGNGVRESGYSTWKARAGTLLRMAAWQLENCPSADGSLFSQFTVANVLTGLYPAMEATPRMKADCQIVLDSLIDAGERGVISDWPQFFRHRQDGAGTHALERSRRGEELPARLQLAPARQYQHFSDAFVGAFVERALWFQENLGDQIMDLWALDRGIKEDFAKLGRNSVWPDVVAARAENLRKYEWKDATGAPLAELKYPILQHDGVADELTTAWPPTSMKSFRRVIGLLQGCNFGVVNLCTGARSSEILAADDTPLGQSEGRYHSITFKMVDEVSGKPRDWPLHPAAVRAMRIQHHIAEAFRPEGDKHLWVALQGDRGTRLTSASATFERAVAQLGLGHLLDDRNAHMHRWRHTVARLVALAVVGAPQVLLDLFGHRDLEMTLHYMLSSPDIAEEAMKVAKETTYAMVQDAVAETVREEAGGAAAQALREGLSRTMRRGEDAVDSATLRETAEILAHGGRYWSLVRPGVICTKGLGEYGPCTAGRGAPDPGSCRTSCDKRLEMAMAKAQCEQALDALVAECASAVSDEREMLVANFDGQILAELERWDDVRERVLAAHPEVKAIWEAAQP